MVRVQSDKMGDWGGDEMIYTIIPSAAVRGSTRGCVRKGVYHKVEHRRVEINIHPPSL